MIFQVLHYLVAFLVESLPCFAQSSKNMNYHIRITEISCIFYKITYLGHIMVATAVSDINNKQHTKKLGTVHSCYEIFTRGPFSPGRVSFGPTWVNFDPGSIFFISLPK